MLRIRLARILRSRIGNGAARVGRHRSASHPSAPSPRGAGESSLSLTAPVSDERGGRCIGQAQSLVWRGAGEVPAASRDEAEAGQHERQTSSACCSESSLVSTRRQGGEVAWTSRCSAHSRDRGLGLRAESPCGSRVHPRRAVEPGVPLPALREREEAGNWRIPIRFRVRDLR